MSKKYKPPPVAYDPDQELPVCGRCGKVVANKWRRSTGEHVQYKHHVQADDDDHPVEDVTFFRAKEGKGVCDFCCGSGPVLVFVPQTEILAVTVDEEIDLSSAWAACGPCADDIVNKRPHKLIDRSLLVYKLRHGPPKAHLAPLRRAIKEAHANFFASKPTGPFPLTGEETK